MAARHGNRVRREQSNPYMTGQLLDHTLMAANASAGISASKAHEERDGRLLCFIHGLLKLSQRSLHRR